MPSPFKPWAGMSERFQRWSPRSQNAFAVQTMGWNSRTPSALVAAIAECLRRSNHGLEFANAFSVLKLNQKLAHQVETEVDQQRLGAAAQTVLVVVTRWIPRLVRNDCPSVYSGKSRHRNYALAVAIARGDVLQQRVRCAWPDSCTRAAPESGIEVQRFIEPVGNALVNGVLPEAGSEPLRVTLSSLFPLLRMVAPLIDTRRHCCTCEPERAHRVFDETHEAFGVRRE